MTPGDNRDDPGGRPDLWPGYGTGPSGYLPGPGFAETADDYPHGPRPGGQAARPAVPALLFRRRRARRRTAVVHVLGVLGPGFLALAAVGAGEGVPGDLSSRWLAGLSLGVLAAAWVLQMLALRVSRETRLEVRRADLRAAEHSPPLPQWDPGPAAVWSDRVDDGTVRVAVWGLVAAAWLIQAGFAAQDLDSLSAGGSDGQVSELFIGLLLIALLVAFPSVICGGFALLSLRSSARARELAPALTQAIRAAAAAPRRPGDWAGARAGDAPDPAEQLAALGQARRSLTVHIAVRIVLAAGIAAFAVSVLLTGHWTARYTLTVPVLLVISCWWAARCWKARKTVVRAQGRLRALR